MSEDDVRGEQRGVRKRERDADGLGLELDVGQEIHTGDGQPQGESVPNGSRPDRGKQDHGEELDGRDRAQRECVDGDVEARVHHGEDDAERDDEVLRRAVHPGERAPRPAPEREHRRSADDSKPGDAEGLHAREEEHRERRSEVVEDGAADEVRLGRRPLREGLSKHVTILGADLA